MSTTHLMTAPILDTSLTTTPSTVSNKVSCKIENILSDDIVIKPEQNNDHKSSATDCKEKQKNYEQVAIMSPHANYAMLEPEMSISPARGSTGLTLLPVQSPAVQPIENNNISNLSDSNLNKNPTNNNCNIQRKARIGKSMERERLMMMNTNGYQNSSSNNAIINLTSSNKDPNDYPNTIVKQEYALKQENAVKKEKDYEEDVIECIDDKMDIESVKIEPETQHQEKVSPDNINSSNNDDVTFVENSPESIGKRKLDVIELSDSSTVVDDYNASAVKRRKLLEKPIVTAKKSPPNSYKSLIKRPNPASSNSTPAKSKLVNIGSIKTSLKYKTILKTRSNRLKLQKSKRRLLKSIKNQKANKRKRAENKARKETTVVIEDEDESIEEIEDKDSETLADLNGDESCVEINDTSKEETEIPLETNANDNHTNTKLSNIDLTIDRVAKGYFSESEILSRVSCYRLQKLKKQEKRSQSEANRSNKKEEKSKKLSPLATVSISSSECTSSSAAPTPVETDEKSAKDSNNKKSKKKQTSNNNCNNCVDKNQMKNTKSKLKNNKNSADSKSSKKSKLTKTNKVDKKSKSNKKAAKTLTLPLEIEHQADEEKSNATSIESSGTVNTTTTMATIATSTTIPATVPKRKYNKKNKADSVEDKKPAKNSSNNKSNKSVSAASTPKPELQKEEDSTDNKSVIDEIDVANNNKECFENNNKFKEFAESISESVKLTPKTPRTENPLASLYSLAPKHLSMSRRNKKGKFYSKKRYRQQLLKDLDDLMVAKKNASIPRWSNGWDWEGDPYQAYVFLNVSIINIHIDIFMSQLLHNFVVIHIPIPRIIKYP